MIQSPNGGSNQDQRYPYGAQFQDMVLAFLLRDTRFSSEYFDAIKPSYFSLDTRSALAKIVLEYIERHRTAPSREILEAVLYDYYTRYNIPQEIQRSINELVWNLFSRELTDADFVRDRVVGFGRVQAMKISVLEIAQILDSPKIEELEKLDECRHILDKALQVGTSRNMGSEFFQVLNDIPGLISNSQLFGSKFKVSSMLPTMDRITRGGYSAGELIVFSGPPKRGKSIVLLNQGLAPVIYGGTLVYFTIGDLKEIDIMTRLAQRLTGFTTDQLLTQSENYLRAVANLIVDGRRAFVKYYPPNRASVQTLRSYLSVLEGTKGVRPTCIVVDYADKLVPSKGNIGNTYLGMSEIYGQLIELGYDYGCPVLTASQIGKGAYDKEEIDLSDLKDSSRKQDDLDMLIFINQTKDEKARNRARLTVAAGRRGEDGVVIPVILDKAKMLMMEEPAQNAPGR